MHIRMKKVVNNKRPWPKENKDSKAKKSKIDFKENETTENSVDQYQNKSPSIRTMFM
jgi:hypothetical protein